MIERTEPTLSPELLRLAFINDWSDALILRAVNYQKGSPEEVISAICHAANELCIASLPGADPALMRKSTKALGFESVGEFSDFMVRNPSLSNFCDTQTAFANCGGRVVELSMTEVVFMSEESSTLMSFERAKANQHIAVGDKVSIDSSGAVLVETNFNKDEILELAQTSPARFDSTKNFSVLGQEFDHIDKAVLAASAASKLKENNYCVQICQTIKKGIYGYAGTSVAFATFRNGVDLDSLAADEDGEPDLELRSRALCPKG